MTFIFPDYTFNNKNGKCYKLHTTPLSWNEAKVVCRLEQSTLAMISNRVDADYLVKLIESTPKPRVRRQYQRGIYHLGFHNRINEGWRTVGGTCITLSYSNVPWYLTRKFFISLRIIEPVLIWPL